MAKLPRRPPTRPLPAPEAQRGELLVLPVGSEFARIYFAGGPPPGSWSGFRTWGPTRSRFDHHEPPPGDSADRAILYAGDTLTTAVGEVFQESRVIDVGDDEPYLTVFTITREILLLDLRSNWPTRAGASQEMGSGNHASCRNWSRAIWEDHANVEGISWHSSMNHGGTAFALYERARDAISPRPVTNLPLATRGLADPLAHAADSLAYGLVLSGRPYWTGAAASGVRPRRPIGRRRTRTSTA